MLNEGRERKLGKSMQVEDGVGHLAKVLLF
jgi:hypothetical protein